MNEFMDEEFGVDLSDIVSEDDGNQTEEETSEEVAEESGETGSCSGSILWSKVESLHANEHHGAIDEESDANERCNHDCEVVHKEPVGDDEHSHKSHEDDGGQCTTTMEELIG